MRKETADSLWLKRLVQLEDGYQAEAVERFTGRLLGLAESRMPVRLKRRVDPEDIVQSAFRSFFQRNQAGQFSFAESGDVWRLLAAITYRKVQRSLRFHQQKQRDVRQEVQNCEEFPPLSETAADADALVIMMDLLDSIMSQLPEKHQQIVQLRMENYSIPEIAENLKVSSRTVDRALALVRKIATENLDKP